MLEGQSLHGTHPAGCEGSTAWLHPYGHFQCAACGIREHSLKSQEHNTVSTKSTPPVAWTLVAGVLPSHGLHGPGAALSSSDGHCLSTPRLITIEDQVSAAPHFLG